MKTPEQYERIFLDLLKDDFYKSVLTFILQVGTLPILENGTIAYASHVNKILQIFNPCIDTFKKTKDCFDFEDIFGLCINIGPYISLQRLSDRETEYGEEGILCTCYLPEFSTFEEYYHVIISRNNLELLSIRSRKEIEPCYAFESNPQKPLVNPNSRLLDEFKWDEWYKKYNILLEHLQEISGDDSN